MSAFTGRFVPVCKKGVQLTEFSEDDVKHGLYARKSFAIRTLRHRGLPLPNNLWIGHLALLSEQLAAKRLILPPGTFRHRPITERT